MTTDVLTATPSLLAPGVQAPFTTASPPPGFADLHLDVALTGAGPFQRAVWYAPPSEPGTVTYRQEVVAELREPGFRDAATRLVAATGRARQSLDAFRKAPYRVPAELQLAAAIGRYTRVIGEVTSELDELRPSAAGLRDLAGHLAGYVAGREFRELAESTVLARIRLGTVELGIRSGTVWADRDAGRPGWGEQIERTFSRFHEPGQQVEPDWSRPRRYLNHVEAQAIGLLAGLFPDLFAELHGFVGAHSDFLPATLEQLAEELRFYLDFLKLTDDLSTRGVAWCLPRLSPDGGAPVRVSGMVDLALAVGAATVAEHHSDKLEQQESSRALQGPIANDLTLTGGEQVAFVTGPNQGGKTTFARSFGQLAYLAGLGLPVPARTAALPWFRPVLTHFPAPDDPDHDRGGLADELHRLHEVMAAAGPHTLLIFNELFSATSAADALQLSARVVEQLRRLGCRVVWVTFLEELVLDTAGAVSLVGQVEPGDVTRPTFRFLPQPPGGRSHAVALAARHGLSGADLEERLS